MYLKHKVTLNEHIQIASLPERSALHLPRILKPMVYGIVAEIGDGSTSLAFYDDYNLTRLDDNECRKEFPNLKYNPDSQFCASINQQIKTDIFLLFLFYLIF